MALSASNSSNLQHLVLKGLTSQRDAQVECFISDLLTPMLQLFFMSVISLLLVVVARTGEFCCCCVIL